jgi:WD40 repeat protein
MHQQVTKDTGFLIGGSTDIKFSLTVSCWQQVREHGQTTGRVTVFTFYKHDRRLDWIAHLDTSVDNLEFSPDGETLAFVSNGAVHIWDTATWTERISLSDHFYTSSFDFSPDGTLLASSGTYTLRLWNVESVSQIRTLALYRDFIWMM